MGSGEFDDETVRVSVIRPAAARLEGDLSADADLEADTVIIGGRRSGRRAFGVTASPTSSAVSAEAPPVEPPGPTAGYRWSVNGSTPRPLDRPVLIGRAPRTPRVVEGAAPLLETVQSPGKLVSSTHVRLERQGTSVVVTDVRSTNGTLVTSPGAARVALGPGDSIVAVPGTLIEIGDDNVIEILPVERARPKDLPPFERLVP